jgi:hypothetical protein
VECSDIADSAKQIVKANGYENGKKMMLLLYLLSSK